MTLENFCISPCSFHTNLELTAQGLCPSLSNRTLTAVINKI
uniref:Uncharacterized protein n=1 Tax=Lepeophtheirus salmonis TaxID=72036 RepID=A0A0K2UDD6_LEPSM